MPVPAGLKSPAVKNDNRPQPWGWLYRYKPSSLAEPDADAYSLIVKLLLENLPASLQEQRDTLARCLSAMDAALPLRQVILFGSHARGEARPDSDVDLCLISYGAERQLAAATTWRGAMRAVDAKPSFTLIPITPARLNEKQSCGDFFFNSVLKEGVPIATED